MPLVSLRLKDLGPFQDIEFEFDEQVNLFVGPNNCGKTTALLAIADLVGSFFSLPTKLLREDSAPFRLTIQKGTEVSTPFEGTFPMFNVEDRLPLDDWRFVATVLCSLGFSAFIPAIRSGTDFRSTGPQTNGDTPSEKDVERSHALKELERLQIPGVDCRGMAREIRRREELLESAPLLVEDDAVVQAIVDLDYQSYREKKPTIRRYIAKITEIASEITEEFPIRFAGVGKDENGLFPEFKTPDGKLPLDRLSQGTQSLFQWLAHLVIGYAKYYDFPRSLKSKPGILIVDEIDAHLHPTWQRRILPTLTKHFPKLQIFCSTHSPLMIAGLQAGQVQLLRRNGRGQVSVTRNDADIRGWSADEILRNLLDISDPTDLHTAKRVSRLQQLRGKTKLSQKERGELEELRQSISGDLIGESLADRIESAAAKVNSRSSGSTRGKKGKRG